MVRRHMVCVRAWLGRRTLAARSYPRNGELGAKVLLAEVLGANVFVLVSVYVRGLSETYLLCYLYG